MLIDKKLSIVLISTMEKLITSVANLLIAVKDLLNELQEKEDELQDCENACVDCIHSNYNTLKTLLNGGTANQKSFAVNVLMYACSIDEVQGILFSANLVDASTSNTLHKFWSEARDAAFAILK